MEKKQTAVELLEQQLKERYSLMNSEPLFEQAKEMEKEQIIEGYCNGCADLIKDENIFPRETSEKYFQEIYGGQDDSKG